MQVDEDSRVLAFQEKPEEPAPMPGSPDTCLASMGIYVFNTEFLFEQLLRDAEDPESTHDFGFDIIPKIVKSHRMFAYSFTDSNTGVQAYWRDVGTIDGYWQANMELVEPDPELNIYDKDWPIRTAHSQLPPAKFVFDQDERRGYAVDSLVSGGCIISGASVRKSLLYNSVRVHSHAKMDGAVVLPECEIGRHCELRNCVIDRGVSLPEGTRVGVDHEEDLARGFRVSIAAEHGGYPGGKVGGIGDVIAQLPTALRAQGSSVDILLPSYGVYHEARYSRLVAEAKVQFAGAIQRITLHQMLDDPCCWVVHHPIFGSPPGQIYHHDPQDSPFATDANIYALFCASAVQLLRSRALPTPDVVHLHDWHAATFALLAKITPTLSDMPLVYTVHNLALQGVRPLRGHPSSLESWFGELGPMLPKIIDPRHPDCYNPMRAGIVLADRVHVVSPTYAEEVLEANDTQRGFHGGEGLECDLQRRADDHELVGILNGCEYPANRAAALDGAAEVDDAGASCDSRTAMLNTIDATLAGWFAINDTLRSSDYLARETLAGLRTDLAKRFLVTSVGRLTHQKLGLLLHKNSAGQTLLARLLESMDQAGALVLLGSGDDAFEAEWNCADAGDARRSAVPGARDRRPCGYGRRRG